MSLQITGIARLPEELLLHVWDYLELLAQPAPSVANFDTEPSYRFTRCSKTPMKDLSLVCKRWRNLLLPNLFMFSRIILSPLKRWIALTPQLLQVCERRVTGNPLASPRELELIRTMRNKFWGGTGNDKHAVTLEYVGDDRLMLQVGHEFLHWIPSAHGEVNEYLDFVTCNSLTATVRSLALSCAGDFTRTDAAYNCAMRECTILWKTVFTKVLPQRVAVAAHPTVMALLTGSRLGAHDDWLFKQDVHYLELSCETNTNEQQLSLPSQIALHSIREWTHLSYNEGSSIPAYKQYEYFHYNAPAVLAYLLLWISKEQHHRAATRLQSVRYIACFPLAMHVSELLDSIRACDSLEAVEMRLSPDPASDLLDDSRMGRSDRKDCWQEWNQCYHNVVKFVERMPVAKRKIAVKVADYSNSALTDDLDKIVRQSRLIAEEGVWRQP